MQDLTNKKRINNLEFDRMRSCVSFSRFFTLLRARRGMLFSHFLFYALFPWLLYSFQPVVIVNPLPLCTISSNRHLYHIQSRLLLLPPSLPRRL